MTYIGVTFQTISHWFSIPNVSI